MAVPTRPGGLEASYFSGPLQFIRIDDAAGILRQIQGKLAVVGIAGLYRTGKSFLLNRLLGLQEGFEIGPSVNPCTKGLWIWGQPVQVEPDYHCILIDTEGLGSTQRTASCDMQIFSLCLLLTSYFIYNSIGAIDEQSLEDLHLVLHLAKHIHVRSQQGGEQSASELGQELPRFLWVLRDFHLELVDEDGATISERQYLENALRPAAGQDRQKNKLREVIRDLFRERDCVTLARPCSNEADLRNINRMKYDTLRPQFRAKVEGFVKKVYKTLQPKRVQGAPVTGATLVSLAEEYCKAINDSAVPNIQAAWTSAVQHQLRLCLNDATKAYQARMQEQVLSRLPMAEEELRSAHKAAKAAALAVFLAPRFDANEPKFAQYREDLAGRIRQMHEHARSENMTVSQQQCERCAQELYETQVGGKLNVKGTYGSFVQLVQDWDQLQRQYMARTAGPAQPQVLSTWLFRRMTESVERVWEQLQERNSEQLEALRQQLSRAEAESAQGAQQLEAAARECLAKQEALDRQFLQSRTSLERSAKRLGAPDALPGEPMVDPERSCVACAVS